MELRDTNCIGRVVQHYASTPEYPRHSEGAFLKTTDGRILFVYSRFRESTDDDAPCDLVAAWSADQGETWTEPVVIVSAQKEYGVKNVMSVSLLRMQNGDVGLFYVVKQAPRCNRVILARSADEGRTFYRRADCLTPAMAAYYVLNNDRIIRLRTGRLVMPLAYHRGGFDSGVAHYFDGRAAALFMLSDDDGETWREARDAVYAPFTATCGALQEPGVVELPGGVVQAYFRTDKMFHYEAFSMDGGEHWTHAQPSRFTGPMSPMTIQRVADGYRAVWNPVPVYNGRGRGSYPAYGGRTPLVIAASRDGLAWDTAQPLGNDPDCGYCYPALCQTDDGCLLVAYLACYSGGDHLYIRKINL